MLIYWVDKVFCLLDFGHHPTPDVVRSLRFGAHYSFGLDSGDSTPKLRGGVASTESGSPARLYLVT